MRKSLTIGISDPNLSGLEKNAIEWDRMLANPKYNFSRKLIHGDSATRQNILDSITQFVKDLADDDMGVIYFSGHGSTKVTGDNLRLVQTVYSKDTEIIYDYELRLILDKKPKNATLIFIAESCHSGNLTDIIEQVLAVFKQVYPLEFVAEFENIEPDMISIGSLIKIINKKQRNEIIEFGNIFNLIEKNSVLDYEIRNNKALHTYGPLILEREINIKNIEKSVATIKSFH